MTDASHRERKMPKKQVLWHLENSLTKWTCQHVTKSNDILSQRHEKLGAEFFFNILKMNKLTMKPMQMTGIDQLPNSLVMSVNQKSKLTHNML